MANTIYSGSTGTIYIGSTAVASLRSFSIEETQEVIDATTMSVTGVAFRSNKPTFKSVSGSAEVFWTADEPTSPGNHDDKTSSTGPSGIADTQPGSTEVTVNFWPTGDDLYEIAEELNNTYAGYEFLWSHPDYTKGGHRQTPVPVIIQQDKKILEILRDKQKTS